ncbi:MAG: hypothetical protein ACOH5I_23065 [Oligoflexus sp.]
MKKALAVFKVIAFSIICWMPPLSAQYEADYELALRRIQYVLNGTVTTDEDYAAYSISEEKYREAVRQFIDHPNFYHAVLRHHQRIFGVGLPEIYLEELTREDIDGKQEKFASITCSREGGVNERFRCIWTSHHQDRKGAGCPSSWEKPASVFWYPGMVAWVCPSILTTCGPDLSRCFIRHANEDEARNSELGTTESFDSRFAVINSLSRQAAGLAAAVVVENYPYTKILEPGLTAIDGAIAHFYRQSHHFKIDGLNLSQDVMDLVESTQLIDTRFQLFKTADYQYASGGVLTSFGWLRRYDKNRTRANELYKRLLCREFSSELPRVFPQDPGNLRETEGCSGCHAVLDPLADFFLAWGEGAELYQGEGQTIETYFNNQYGQYPSDLIEIIRNDQAFGACAVQHTWQWLIGRKFYTDESDLRNVLTEYFQTTSYSFKELIYAIATHPVFLANLRGDAAVTDPLEQPPLGQAPGSSEQECTESYDYSADIAPKATQFCTGCHNPTRAADTSVTPSSDLTTEAAWINWGSQSVDMIGSGQMPPGPQGAEVAEFREIVRCWIQENGY